MPTRLDRREYRRIDAGQMETRAAEKSGEAAGGEA